MDFGTRTGFVTSGIDSCVKKDLSQGLIIRATKTASTILEYDDTLAYS